MIELHIEDSDGTVSKALINPDFIISVKARLKKSIVCMANDSMNGFLTTKRDNVFLVLESTEEIKKRIASRYGI